MEAYYSKVDIKSCRDADFILKFSSLKIRNVKKIVIDAVSSDIKVDNVQNVTLKAINGDVELGKLGEIQVATTMCTLEIESLSQSMQGVVK